MPSWLRRLSTSSSSGWLDMYRTYYDEIGDEVVELEEDRSKWNLPSTYRFREVQIAAENMWQGHDRAELAISRNTLHQAVQLLRAYTPHWGKKFAKDPRQFSSMRREQ